MPRRPSELSVRPRLVAPRRPKAAGGEQPSPFAEPEIPIPPEQEESLLARFEIWRAKWNGSLPEFIVFEWLVIRKKQVPQIDFVFQHPLFGGRTQFGGFVLDFYFPGRREGWRVMGERWHMEQASDRARDAIARVQLAGEGLRIVDLFEDDLLERPELVLSLAWERAASAKSKVLS